MEYKGHQIESAPQILYYMKARISRGGGGVGGGVGGSIGMKFVYCDMPRLRTTLYLQWTTKV